METLAVKVTEKGDLLQLDSLTQKVVIKKGNNQSTRFIVEYRTKDAANVEAFQLIKVTEAKVKKETVYSFSYKDLVNAAYRPTSIETSINKTTKAEYSVPGTGIFAL